MIDLKQQFCVPHSAFENSAIFQDFFWRLVEIGLNEFEWKGLPKTCDERFLELCLLFNGSTLVFLKRPENTLLNLQYTASISNMYHIPIRRNVYFITGGYQECDETDSVIVYNNRTRYPTAYTIYNYADRLTRLQRSIDVNVNVMKTPYIIRGNKQQKKSLETMYSKVDSYSEMIMVDEQTDMLDKFGVFKTDAPMVFPDLYLQKQRVWAEALTFLGVNNTNTDKRERLTDDEVNSNNDEIVQARFTRLVSRETAAKLINERFADVLEEEVTVGFRKGGSNIIGNLYDGTKDSDGGIDGENETRTV